MALESGTYISDLVITNPTSTDPKSEGDNHLRLIKSTLKATFPNVTGAVMTTQDQLNSIGRNKVINGNFGINQRAYVSGAATTAGQYTLDRWKVTGTGGVTFSTTANKTTVTIPSGQTLQQVIEGLSLESGTYVLSWEGTAQGRIDSGSYGASGAVTASVTGGTNTTIEFNTGTVARVMFEKGTVASSFEFRPHQQELALCQRYYYRMQANDTIFGFGPVSADSATRGYATGTFPVPMRTDPPAAFEQSGTASHYTVRTGGVDRVSSAVPSLTSSSTSSVWVLETTVASGQTAGQAGLFIGTSASAYLGWSAEL